MTNQEILAHVQRILEDSDGELRTVLLREMLLGIVKLNDYHLDTLDLKILNRTLKELRYAFKVFQTYRNRPKISMFGSARTQSSDPNYQLAYRFARRLVERGFMVITGGADGIMRAGQEGAGRDNSFGVNIMLPFEQGPNATIADDPKLITFKYFFTRKLLFVKESNGTALFPGGFGTHDEGFEVLTLMQTGKSHPQPIVCLEAPGCDYWDCWHGFIRDQLLCRGLISPEDMSLFKIFQSEEAAVQEIEQFYRNYHSVRSVHRDLVVRVRQSITPEQLEGINVQFADLLERGAFEARIEPLPEELDEPELKEFPRLVFQSNRKSASRLRQLIDHLNLLSAASVEPAELAEPIPPAGL
jgi:uncharacterized protein (TIGR00730 family)